MNGVPWRRGLDPLGEFHREVGRILGSIGPIGVRLPRPFPAMNLYESDDAFLITVELPGVATRDLELSISGDTLTLRGERRRSEEVTDEQYRRQERPFGRWSRTVALPSKVEDGAVTAHHAHGVLTIAVPKVDDSTPRQIPVTTSP